MGHLYGQLSQNERLEIYHFSRRGLSIRAIGRRLMRAASTISREIVRNSHVRRQWCPVRAHKLTNFLVILHLMSGQNRPLPAPKLAIGRSI